GHAPVVRAYDAETGTLKFEAAAYGPTFTGGVRVGTADLNADGVPDAVVAPGPGRSPLIRVLDGKTGDQSTVTVTGQQSPPVQPTGTVTLSATTDPGGVAYSLGTATVAADGSGYRATANFDFGSLPAAFYRFSATYSGDSNYYSTSANGSSPLTVSAS